MFFTAFTWRYTTDYFGAIMQTLFGVKSTVFSGKTLGDDFGVTINQNTHTIFSICDIKKFCQSGNVASFHSYIAGAIACASIAAKKYVLQPNYNEAALGIRTTDTRTDNLLN